MNADASWLKKEVGDTAGQATYYSETENDSKGDKKNGDSHHAFESVSVVVVSVCGSPVLFNCELIY
jgi:hypothetical protein